jgi:isopentenyl diphosphate isomerase/L-lactate dehydrogenase-like FMN-dependent dehydrogenase
VERVISILRDELERAMALTGRRSIEEIDATVLWRNDNNVLHQPVRHPPVGG